MQVTTETELARGEELCISYIDVNRPRAARRAELRNCYCFECGCPRCVREEGVAEQRDKLSYAGSSNAGKMQRTKREQRALREQRNAAKAGGTKARGGEEQRSGEGQGGAGGGTKDEELELIHDVSAPATPAKAQKEPWFASLA